jgi:hypothetical protein
MASPLDQHLNDFSQIPEDERKNKFNGSFASYLDSVGAPHQPAGGATDKSPLVNDQVKKLLNQRLLEQLTNPDVGPTGTYNGSRGFRANKIGAMKTSAADQAKGGSAVDQFLVPRLTQSRGNPGFSGPIKDGFGVALPPLSGSRTSLPLSSSGRLVPPPPTVNPAHPSIDPTDVNSLLAHPLAGSPAQASKKDDPLSQALATAPLPLSADQLAGNKAAYDAQVSETSVATPLDPLAKKIALKNGTNIISTKYGSVVSTPGAPGAGQGLVGDPYQKNPDGTDKLVPFSEATASYMKNGGDKIASALTAADKGATAGANYMQGVQDSNPVVQQQRAIIQERIGKGLMADGRAFPAGTTDEQKAAHWNQYAPVNGSVLPDNKANAAAKAAEVRIAKSGAPLPSMVQQLRTKRG